MQRVSSANDVQRNSNSMKKASNPGLPANAVILAGGRGTRFWPRSRTHTPKQLLNIVGERTMLQQTAARLAPLFSPAQIWVVTNRQQSAEVRKQLARVPRAQVLAEPIGRNTAAAIGLAAIHLAHEARHRNPHDALMAVLPADHFIGQPERYRAIVGRALAVASEFGAMAVLGIPPTHPETGFGYIERMPEGKSPRRSGTYAVRRFTEKPPLATARRYVASGKYFWNAGMFFWRVSTFLENLHRFLPKTYEALRELAATIGTPGYDRALAAIYPRLENISVDYAVLEPSTRGKGARRVYVLPAEVGWSDIGSWAAVYDLMAGPKKKAGAQANVTAGAHYTLEAEGNFLWSPRKFLAAIGVSNLVVVETPDALLICPRDRAQDVGKIVKWLEEHNRKALL
jgi:mannose-1-phosphate guanylyltransferase